VEAPPLTVLLGCLTVVLIRTNNDRWLPHTDPPNSWAFFRASLAIARGACLRLEVGCACGIRSCWRSDLR